MAKNVKMIIDDTIATLADNGYKVEAEYTNTSP